MDESREGSYTLDESGAAEDVETDDEWRDDQQTHELALKIMDARLAIWLVLYAQSWSTMKAATHAREITDELFGCGLTTDEDEEDSE